jgi:hypothetical protein
MAEVDGPRFRERFERRTLELWLEGLFSEAMCLAL